MIIVVSMSSCNLRGKDKSQKTFKTEKLEWGFNELSINLFVRATHRTRDPSHAQFDLLVCGRVCVRSHALKMTRPAYVLVSATSQIVLRVMNFQVSQNSK